MKQVLTINKRAFEFVINQHGFVNSLYECGEKIEKYSVDEYIHIREALSQEKLCYPDFDGKLKIASDILSRFCYCILNSDAALFCGSKSDRIVYLKSPIDVIVLTYRNENVIISSVFAPDAYNIVNKQITENNLSIKVANIRKEKNGTYVTDALIYDSESAAKALSSFMASSFKPFYWGE